MQKVWRSKSFVSDCVDYMTYGPVGILHSFEKSFDAETGQVEKNSGLFDTLLD